MTIRHRPDPAIEIRLLSTDGYVVCIGERAARKSKMLQTMLTNLSIQNLSSLDLREPIQVPASTDVLRAVVKWCRANRDRPDILVGGTTNSSPVQLTEEDKKFCSVGGEKLHEYLHLANFLDIQDIIEIGSQYIANMCKEKSVDQLMEIFMLETPSNPKSHEKRAEPH